MNASLASVVEGLVPRVEIGGEVLGRVFLQAEAQHPQRQRNAHGLLEAVVPERHRPAVKARPGVFGHVDRQPVSLALAGGRGVHA